MEGRCKGKISVKQAIPAPRASGEDFVRRYKELVNNWPLDQPPPSLKEDEAWALANFGPGMREAVREARRQYAPDEWKQPGRRRSKTNRK
jgi:hypothetical protein